MGVDYTIHVKRKSDNRELGSFCGNVIKGILDSSYSGTINCEGRNCNNARFTFEDLQNVISKAWNDIDKYHDQIFEKKMMIMLAVNADVKHDIEEDIRYIKSDYIEDAKIALECCSELMGEIQCITEDNIKGEDPAYQYNGSDLPMKKGKYGDGTEYESSQYIWNSDIYCEVEADW